MKRILLLAIYSMLLPWMASRAIAQLTEAEEINSTLAPGFRVFAASINDIGWYYTAHSNYQLVRINTKFLGFSGNPDDVNRNVAIALYTERPALGGTMLTSETFNSSIARGFLNGANLSVPINVTSGTQYFIGIHNTSNLGVCVPEWNDSDGSPVNANEVNLINWASSFAANNGQFTTLIPPDPGVPKPPFAAPILQFMKPATATPTPTPTPTPPPGGCIPNPSIPVITNANLPFHQTVRTQANLGDMQLFFAGDELVFPDAFWRFLPSQSGSYLIKVEGYDLALGVMQGTCCNALEDYSQDFYYGGEVAVRQLNENMQYLIVAKGNRMGSIGDVSVTIDGPLVKTVNDLWTSATIISPAALPYAKTFNTYMNSDTFTPAAVLASDFGEAGGPDAWWKFTPAVSGLYEVRLESPEIFSALGIYTGTYPALSEVGSVDSGNHGCHLVRHLDAGTTYSILADGHGPGASGEMVLSVRGPGAPTVNATAQTATVVTTDSLPFITEFDTTFNGSIVDGSTPVSLEGGNAPDAWWKFTPSATGLYVIGLKSIDGPEFEPDRSLIDESFTVFTGDPAHLSEVSSLDETNSGEMAKLTLTAGTTYYILAEGRSSMSDFGQMRLLVDGPAHPAPNNLCTNAIIIPPAILPASIYLNTLGSGSFFDSPIVLEFDGAGGGPEAWYRFTPTVSGFYVAALDLDTGGLGLNLDVTVSIFSGDCAELEPIGAADDADGIFSTPERARAYLTAGTEYRICCEGYSSTDAGPMRLLLSGPYSPSYNDACSANAINGAEGWTLYD